MAFSEDDSRRLDLLQALRGLAVLAVMLHHTLFYPLRGFQYCFHLADGAFDGGWIGVDAFFCLSGFVMAWVHGDDIGIPERARSFAFKRFFRIYPPYLVFLLFTYLFLLVASRALGLPPLHSPLDLLGSLFLLPPYDHLVIGVAWTLTHEALFYALFCVAILAGPRLAKAGAVGWTLGIVLFARPIAHAAMSVESDSPFVSFVFNPVNLEFLGGIVAAACVRRWRGAPQAFAWAALALCATILGIGYAHGTWHNFRGIRLPPDLVEKVALTVAFSGLLFGLVRLELDRVLRAPAFLVALGTASYSVYLLHENVMRWIGYGTAALFPGLFSGAHPAAIQALLIGAFAATLGISLAYYRTVEKPLLKRCRDWLKAEEKRSA